ncbi:MAG TPA: prenyltransferase/squalene oxidase repeat-containing protein, partial [Pirellulaceae bacterium]|nr:prenyltransferase/squalene oxidase repeat-containing protein [Pirellulaceae bacterium]
LLKDQRPEGAWGSAERTKGLNIYAPVPGAHHGFRSATTALCVSALIETGGDKPEVKAAIERGEKWLLENLPGVRRASNDAIYNVWAHAYGIQALVKLFRRHDGDQTKQNEIREQIKMQIDLLGRYETVSGGWGYYDFEAQTQKPSGSPTSFTTATALVAFHDAKSIGIEVPQKLIDRAVASIQRQKKPDLSYVYGEYLKYVPQHPVNLPGGSVGRSQACNLALRLFGDEQITDAAMKAWLERLIARNLWLDIGRKRPIPHESWFAVAGYFFYYGHYYAAECIGQLPAEDQTELKHQLARVLLRLQEKDGSWWDYPLYNYHQQYGTAFALMSLERCRVK